MSNQLRCRSRAISVTFFLVLIGCTAARAQSGSAVLEEVAVFVLAVGWLACPAAGQSVNLDLASDAAAPGGEVAIPVYFSAVEPLRLGDAVLDISFPVDRLRYLRAEKGTQDDLVSAQLDVDERQTSQASGQATLRIRISSPSGLPQGFLLKIVFHVSESIEEVEEIKILNVKQEAADLNGREIKSQGLDGWVTVLADLKPLTPCFFYMH